MADVIGLVSSVEIISLCIFSVTKYHLRFNEQRKFNELEKVDTSKAIDAVKLSSQLKGLKWITYFYPNNPEKEIENLLKVIDILSKLKLLKIDLA